MNQQDVCGRCQKLPTDFISRKEHFCKDLFLKFIRVKQRKQMKGDVFKVKFGNNETEIKSRTVKLLCPFLFTRSSLVLVDTLIYWLKEQISMSPKAHVGFYLTILFLAIDKKQDSVQNCVKSLKKTYGGAEMLERLHISFVLADGDKFVSSNDVQEYRISSENEAFYVHENILKPRTLHELLSTISDPSSREYFTRIAKDTIIGDYCSREHYFHVVLPSSMSELATSTLSFTVGGTGERIGAIIGSSNRAENARIVDFLYPLRDVLQYEIEEYAKFCGTSELVKEKEVDISKSVKNKSMDELIDSYFGSIQAEYPEAVSTVVKIGSKLSGPTETNNIQKCQICHETVLDDPKAWINSLTVLEGPPPSNEEELENLRRYKESLFAEKKEDTPAEAKKAILCYGCIVAIKSTRTNSLYWPTFI